MSAYRIPPRDLLLILVICTVWAGNFIAGASGLRHFSPFLFMIFRFALVLLVVFPFIRLPPRGQWFRLLGVCFLIGGLHFTLMFWALSRSADVSSIAIVQQMYIPFAVVLAIVLMRERPGWKTLTATLLAFAGVLVIGFDPLVLNQVDVLAITLASALLHALGSIYQRGIRGVSVLNFQAWTAIVGLPILLVSSLITETGQFEMVRTAPWQAWASIAYSALAASLVGHGLFFFLVQRHPVTAVLPYLQLTPVLAIAFGIFIWGDRPGPRLLAGAVLVILGILLITLLARSKTRLDRAVQD